LTGPSLFPARGLAQLLKVRTDQRVMMPIKSPCEESAARAAPGAAQPCKGPWVLITTILASSMAFIDGNGRQRSIARFAVRGRPVNLLQSLDGRSGHFSNPHPWRHG